MAAESKVPVNVQDRVDAMSEPQRKWLIGLLADPYSSIPLVAENMNLPLGKAQELVKYFRAKHLSPIVQLRTVKTSDFINILEDRAFRALEHISEADLAKASAKDKAIVVGILLEKRQLLRGEPTMILSHEERMGINELVPRLMKEMQRRGIDVGGLVGDVIDITPGGPPQKPPLRPKGGHDEFRRRRTKEAETTGEPLAMQTDERS